MPCPLLRAALPLQSPGSRQLLAICALWACAAGQSTCRQAQRLSSVRLQMLK